MTKRTVEIVGGGLAGLALGAGLSSRGVPVRLTEAGRYPRHRVCGEFITGLDPETSEALGLHEILAGALPARRVSWFQAERRILRRDLPEPAMCLGRDRLDQSLAAAFVAHGGRLQTGRRAETRPGPGRILACGRRPWAGSPWIGLKQHFQSLALQDDLELHFGRRSYVGLTRVGDDTVNVCGLFHRPVAGGKNALLDSLHAAGLGVVAERVAAAIPLEGTACAVAGLGYGRTATIPAAIGDHESLIPPFTGHGMTVALQGAALALEPLESWSRGYCSWDAAVRVLRARMRQRFGRRLAWARAMHPWLLDTRRRAVLRTLSRCGVLPFAFLYHLSH